MEENIQTINPYNVVNNHVFSKFKSLTLTGQISIATAVSVILGCTNLFFYCLFNKIPFPLASMTVMTFLIIFFVSAFLIICSIGMVFLISIVTGDVAYSFIRQASRTIYPISQVKTIFFTILPCPVILIVLLAAMAYGINFSTNNIVLIVGFILVLIAAIMYYLKANTPRRFSLGQLVIFLVITISVCTWTVLSLFLLTTLFVKIAGMDAVTDTIFYLCYSLAALITIAIIFFNLIDFRPMTIKNNPHVKSYRYPVQHLFFIVYSILFVLSCTLIPPLNVTGLTLTALGHGGFTVARYRFKEPILANNFFDTKEPAYTTKPVKLKSDLGEYVYIQHLDDDSNDVIYSFPKKSIIAYEILSGSAVDKIKNNSN